MAKESVEFLLTIVFITVIVGVLFALKMMVGGTLATIITVIITLAIMFFVGKK